MGIAEINADTASLAPLRQTGPSSISTPHLRRCETATRSGRPTRSIDRCSGATGIRASGYAHPGSMNIELLRAEAVGPGAVAAVDQIGSEHVAVDPFERSQSETWITQ